MKSVCLDEGSGAFGMHRQDFLEDFHKRDKNIVTGIKRRDLKDLH
jgi:hypothetical protein